MFFPIIISTLNFEMLFFNIQPYSRAKVINLEYEWLKNYANIDDQYM